MSKPFYTAAAIGDLEDILEFISRDKPGAAVSWVKKMEAKCIAIALTPETGDRMPNWGKMFELSPIGRSMIFHRYVGGRLEILRVVPGGVNIFGL